jgi:hypothetical protein
MSFLNSFVLAAGRDESRAPTGRTATVDAQRPGAPSRVAMRARREIFPVCANPRCETGWFCLWRSRKAPVFEGGWSCSAACTARLVENAIRREMDAQGATSMGHRHRIPLGLTMLEQGWISQRGLRSALTAQRAAGGGRLGGWLVRGECATEDQVTRALGLQWSCPVLGVEFHHPETLTALVPRLFLDAFGALPLRVAAGRIAYIGFEDRPDAALALAVERMAGIHVETGVVAESRFRPAHEQLLRSRFPEAELIESGTEAATVASLTAAMERARPADARLVRVHDCLWLRMWFSPQRGPLPEPGSIRDVICSTTVH